MKNKKGGPNWTLRLFLFRTSPKACEPTLMFEPRRFGRNLEFPTMVVWTQFSPPSPPLFIYLFSSFFVFSSSHSPYLLFHLPSFFFFSLLHFLFLQVIMLQFLFLFCWCLLPPTTTSTNEANTMGSSSPHLFLFPCYSHNYAKANQGHLPPLLFPMN
jgi:hypothetical protein